ncbi:hypothetical protein ACFQVA_41735 [Actinomadura keratinilytica]
MVTDEADRTARSRGLLPLTPGRALRALGRVLDSGATAVGVTRTDWSLFAPAFGAARRRRSSTASRRHASPRPVPPGRRTPPRSPR